MYERKRYNQKMLLAVIFLLTFLIVSASSDLLLYAEDFVPGEVIIDIKHQFLPIIITIGQDSNIVTNLASIDSLNRLYGCKGFEKIYDAGWTPMKGSYLLKFPDTLDINQIVLSYALAPHIYIASPNHIMTVDITPNDYYFPLQWAHRPNLMKSELGWAITPGYNTTILQIIDVCLDWNHFDLAENIWQNLGEDADHDGHTLEWDGVEWKFDPGDLNYYDDDGNGKPDDLVGWDFHGDICDRPYSWWPDNDPQCKSCPPYYASSHGDATSGTAAARTNNTIGVSGENWYCRIMATKAGYGYGIVEDRAAEAMSYGIRNGAQVINMSFGGRNPLPWLYDKIDSAYHYYNITLVASAGNDTFETPHYPAYYNEVIAVAGTDSFDVKRLSSTYGTWVDLSAPGENWVPSRDIRWLFSYRYITGTSISAPFVSGLAALIKGQHLKLWGPTITNSQIETVLDSSCDSIYHLPGNAPYIGKLGSGRINTFKALLAVSRGDVNNSHTINLGDVASLGKYINGIPGYDPIPVPEMGDVNCDGKIDYADCIYLANYIFGVGPKPPICFRYKYPWN